MRTYVHTYVRIHCSVINELNWKMLVLILRPIAYSMYVEDWGRLRVAAEATSPYSIPDL